MPGIMTDAPTEDAKERSMPVVKSILSHDPASQASSCLAALPKVTFVSVDVDNPTFSTDSALLSAKTKTDSPILRPPPLFTLVNPSTSASVSNTNDLSTHKRPLTLLQRRNREKNGMNMSSFSELSVETIQDSLCESYNTSLHEPVAPVIRGWSRKVKAFLSEDHYQDISKALSRQHTKVFRTEQANESPLLIVKPKGDSPVSFQLLRALKGAFTIAAYNILADRYVTTDHYHHCPPAALGESYRLTLVQKEVQEIAPDIIIFAEMTVDAFENSLGVFLRNSMHYEGDHLVITDRKGVPRCSMSETNVMNEACSPYMKDTAGNAQENPVGICMDSSISCKFSNSPTLSGSPCATDYFSERCLVDHEKDEIEKKNLGLVEVVSRRTEMEGVAIFYNRDRFKLLEKIPIRFNNVAVQDPDITDTELRKLQINTHNVALVSVLQDLTTPTQIYIVAAVHLLYQHVKFQIWQSHWLLSVMEGLKWKYQNYDEWLQRQMPTFSLGVGSQPFHRNDLTSLYAVPASFPDESSDPRHVTCLIAGDLNVDKSSPVYNYILKSTILASTPVPQRWGPSGEPGRETSQSYAEEGGCGGFSSSESPRTCRATRACLHGTPYSNDHATTTASLEGVSLDPTRETWAVPKVNTTFATSLVSQKSFLSTSSDILLDKNTLLDINSKCGDADGSSTDPMPRGRTFGSQQNLENRLLRPKVDEHHVVQSSDKRDMFEEASFLSYPFPHLPFHRQSPRLKNSSVRESFWHVDSNTTGSFESSELIKKDKLVKCQATSSIVVETSRDWNVSNEFTSPLGLSKHFDAALTKNVSVSSLKEERDLDVSSSLHRSMPLEGLDVASSEAIQKGSKMASVVLALNLLPLKRPNATAFEQQMSSSWSHLIDHREGLDSPVKTYPAFDQTISSFSQTPHQSDSAPLMLESYSSMYPPDKKSATPPLCIIFPKFLHQIRFSDTYEAYCMSYPLFVSAVNPSTNMEGKVLDHILYEEDQLTCLSVLRLGDNRYLPTRTIPSDHYMVGALLVPNVFLTQALEQLQGPSE
ncbi:unnamed protein product [Phytomonas sp. Hart1]|nr:unnamed protein product [Phytomonas sp. Hart1]|eukprot:CCW68715.1 unnamed protein product [Phytomonas sp. isolate Hart1]